MGARNETLKIFGLAGYSGAGKTMLITRMLPEFARRKMRVSVIKQTHHDVMFDQPGKDSFLHTQAGAQEVILSTPHRWMLSHELGNQVAPGLNDLARRLQACDLVLVEGYRHADLPKLEVHRSETGQPWLYPQDSCIVGVASDQPVADIPWFALDNIPAISDFIWEQARHVNY